MPTLLLSKWFWQLVGFAGLIGGLYLAYHHYEYLKAQAALVPGLQQQLSTYDATAIKLAKKLKDTEDARQRADSDLTKAEGDLQAVQNYLAQESVHAPAQVNPVCRPSDADRKLRNDTIRSIVGLGANQPAAPMPGPAVTPKRSSPAPGFFP